MKRLSPLSSTLDQLTSWRFFYPAMALILGGMTYLYALPRLGWFWDDWEVVFLLHSRSAQLFAGYFAYDRPFAWPYQIMYAIFGLRPVAWHVVTYLLRWGGIMLLYHAFRQVWPGQARHLRWAGLLMLVYPGFLQQSISAAYNRHFTGFLVFALSTFLMGLSTRPNRWAWLLAFAAWAATFVHVFTIEYFVGLELARPLLLWLLLAGRETRGRMRALRSVALWALPYLVILGFYFWWRLAVFPASIPVANYAGDFKLLQDFTVSPLSGMLAVATRACLDLIYATLQVWLAFLTSPDSWTLQGKISWLAFGMGALLALLYWRLDRARADRAESTQGVPGSLVWFSFWAFLVGGLPIWLTSKQLSTQGRWDDRFALALMIPACLLLVSIVASAITPRWQGPILFMLLGLSITTQVLVVNRYRLDWAAQNLYYWQLHWRAPSLEPGTAIISFEQPSSSVPGYDASFAMNILFGGRAPDGNMPYWFFTNDRFLNFDLRPDKAISYKDRNLRFKGNTSAAIALIHQGAARCLQVLDSPYADQPFYGTNQELLVAISDTSSISAESAGPPLTDVFGAEPPHSWCYYFQKADLARQMGDWQTILDLEREARRFRLESGFGPELIPFIEAHARTGDWQGALDLSRQAEATVSEMQPLLCSTWARLVQIPDPAVSVIQSANAAFGCTTP